MLLRFSATNFRSIRDTQEISLVASTAITDFEGALLSRDFPSKDSDTLPVAIFYGANASGKSNLALAIKYMQAAILSSHSQGKPNGGVPRSPFALNDDSKNHPTIFDADFVIDDVRYHYGFEASSKAFTSEWLYSFPNGRRQSLFERSEQSFTFGRALKGRNKIISDLTRNNSLFLSAAAQNDHEELTKIGEFFKSIEIDSSIAIDGTFASHQLAKVDIDKRAIQFLEKIGTGVVGYRKQESKISDKAVAQQQELLNVISKIFGEMPHDPLTAEKTHVNVELAHEGQGGEKVYLRLNQESEGTRRLLMLLGPIFKALDKGTIIVIDEIDASLHTQACEAVIALFSSPKTNPHGAQLIATAHDTNLLRSPLLRRDQIWFAEKDRDGATHFYPLTDIQTRKGDNIELGYLQGRFGAIPFSGSVSELFSITE